MSGAVQYFKRHYAQPPRIKGSGYFPGYTQRCAVRHSGRAAMAATLPFREIHNHRWRLSIRGLAGCARAPE